MSTRIEYDSLGPVEVDNSRLYGPQTQRSFNNFKIGSHKMPLEQIHAMALVKKAAALANAKCNVISNKKAELISTVVDEITSGKLNEEFPLCVFQTGSGTQSNMNVNEVISHRAAQIDPSTPLHPNDDVNRSQSSNDVFPSGMHICAYTQIHNFVLPALDKLIKSFSKLVEKSAHLQKVGRTHLQDATFIFVGQEISGFVAGLKTAYKMIELNSESLLELPLGGTAVGTGINTPDNYLNALESVISDVFEAKYSVRNNKFQGLSLKDRIVMAHSSLRTLATTLYKIANDTRYYGSGPRCGYGEWTLPSNEPGSSIMPGKVNPTQAEAVTMVCAQVFGHDTTMGFCAANGQFQLNVFMPIMIYDFVESCQLLTDVMNSFRIHCVDGITFNDDTLNHYVEQSLQIATALTPHLGYDKASQLVKQAFAENCSIKSLILKENLMSEEDFDKAVRMKPMDIDNL